VDLRITLHELVELAMASLVNTGYHGSSSVITELPLNPDDDIIVYISMDCGEQMPADRVSESQAEYPLQAVPD
jgi:hypothetical protein